MLKYLLEPVPQSPVLALEILMLEFLMSILFSVILDHSRMSGLLGVSPQVLLKSINSGVEKCRDQILTSLFDSLGGPFAHAEEANLCDKKFEKEMKLLVHLS